MRCTCSSKPGRLSAKEGRLLWASSLVGSAQRGNAAVMLTGVVSIQSQDAGRPDRDADLD
jgi:hypothetical protein